MTKRGPMPSQHQPTPPPNAGPTASSPGGQGQILPLAPPRRPAQSTRDPPRDPVRRLEDEEDRRRMQQNVAAAILVLMLIGGGIWLIDHLRTSARIAACVEAGHRNCLPLDLSETPRR